MKLLLPQLGANLSSIIFARFVYHLYCPKRANVQQSADMCASVHETTFLLVSSLVLEAHFVHQIVLRRVLKKNSTTKNSLVRFSCFIWIDVFHTPGCDLHQLFPNLTFWWQTRGNFTRRRCVDTAVHFHLSPSPETFYQHPDKGLFGVNLIATHA